MAEPGVPRPRVALVYGDAARADHLREALDARVDVVYSSTAAGFDVRRLADLKVTAVVVNLDGGDWLEPLADRLEAAGVPVVFNDPAISRTLDGWARARWLRHLTAKLTGSGDCDPPRLGASMTGTDTAGTIVVSAPEVVPVAAEGSGSRADGRETVPAVADGPAAGGEAEPLAEIAAATPQGTNESTAAAARVEPGPAAMVLAKDVEGEMTQSGEGGPDTGREAQQTPASSEPAARGTDAPTGAGAAAPGSDLAAQSLELDPDTAALSAMIDSQLADSVARVPTGSPEVWRVAQGGAVSAVELATLDAPGDETTAEPTDRQAAATESRRAHPVSKPVDEVEVLKGLPALDDWQLVDPGEPTPADPAVAATDQRPRTSIDIAGLELVPMEEAAAVDHHNDPIEHWMDTAERVAAEAARKRRSGGGNPA